MFEFPGTTVTAGSSNEVTVTAIQERLNAAGCGPVEVDGRFGAETLAAVEHFQARSVDANGIPLIIDGRVGPSTWSVLFGVQFVPHLESTHAPSELLKESLSVAASQIGTMEVPPGSNRGPKVDMYIRTAGLEPTAHSYPWCACFVYWCFNTASKSLGRSNPCFKTAGVLELWNEANTQPGALRVTPAEGKDQPSLVVPGMLFLLRTSGTSGHMGFIEEVRGNQLTTVEGNTNDGGNREGLGVYRRQSRTIGQINLGFILYS